VHRITEHETRGGRHRPGSRHGSRCQDGVLGKGKRKQPTCVPHTGTVCGIIRWCAGTVGRANLGTEGV